MLPSVPSISVERTEPSVNEMDADSPRAPLLSMLIYRGRNAE